MRSVLILCVLALTSAIQVKDAVDNMMVHLRALESVARQHNNSRSVQNGYNASAAYVQAQLASVSSYFHIELFPFTVPIWKETADPVLTIHPTPGNPEVPLFRCPTRTGWQHYNVACDYAGVRYGGNGDAKVTGKIGYVANHGCEASDFTGFQSGGIALIAPGTCDYYQKAELAEDAGAAAILLFSPDGYDGYPGSRAWRPEWRVGDRLIQKPVLGVTYPVAQVLRSNGGATVTVETHQDITLEYTHNIIAQTKAGNQDQVVMVGAHLDSVPEGPGVNDNGSGTSTILEMALEMARTGTSPRNAVRFGWWGAEEVGLIGSRHYVDWLVANPDEYNKLHVYMNFDMEASPNYIRMVYNGYEAPEPAQEMSVTVMQMYESYFDKHDMAHARTGMTGGSDYLPFILAGIGSGGLATGAGSLKSDEERSIHKGFANTPFDPCYHAPCDTAENIAQDCLGDYFGAIHEILGTLSNQPLLRAGNSTPPSPQVFRARLAAAPDVESCTADDEQNTKF